jgi:hypothetical protein
MSPPDKEILMAMTTDQTNRLNKSFAFIKPRLGLVADLFEQFLSDSNPGLSSHFPMDRVSFELNMLLICGHVSDLALLNDRYAEMGEDLHAAGFEEYHYASAREAMLRAFASISGYTWTQKLSNDWSELFDQISLAAFAPNQSRSQAA